MSSVVDLTMDDVPAVAGGSRPGSSKQGLERHNSVVVVGESPSSTPKKTGAEGRQPRRREGRGEGGGSSSSLGKRKGSGAGGGGGAVIDLVDGEGDPKVVVTPVSPGIAGKARAGAPVPVSPVMGKARASSSDPAAPDLLAKGGHGLGEEGAAGKAERRGDAVPRGGGQGGGSNSVRPPGAAAKGGGRRRARGGCVGCGAMEEVGLVQCGHSTCVACLKRAVGVGEQAPGKKVGGCVECGERFAEDDLLNFLTVEEKDAVQLRLTLEVLDQDPNVVQCPTPGCSCRIERTSDEHLKREGKKRSVVRVSPDGQELSLRAARHMATYRLRCPDCSTNFCAGCLAVPYHTTFTCEQHKERQAARPCRFCLAPLPPNAKDGATCGAADCKTALEGVCDVRHKSCKHWCTGVFGEAKCGPCLECSGDADEFCNICWTDSIRAQPCITLGCGHTFHLQCLRQRLDKRWPTAKISFSFAECPLCRVWVDHPQLKAPLTEIEKLQKLVQDSAVERLKLEGGHKDKAGLEKHKGSVVALAMSKYNYYQCKKCKRPYFGGMAECGDGVPPPAGGGGQAEDERPVDDLMCGMCSGAALGLKQTNCKQHGEKYIEFKCRYCCEVASFFCFGHTHFCDSCHKKWVQGAFRKPASLVQKCKCGFQHAPNGTTQESEACYGCSLCRIKVKEHAPVGALGGPR